MRAEATRALVILGPRGVGKSTAARLVARALGRPVVDLDAEIERAAGRTVAEIFREGGEARFRSLEADALARALARRDAPVVAPGGGAVLRAENRAAIASSGAHVVVLVASPETLAARIALDPGSAEGRPALSPGGPLEEARALLAAREPLYRSLASVAIATDELAAEEVAGRILAALGG